MRPEISQLDSKYPEITKDRLIEIVLQQTLLIQNMQERIRFIENEIARIKTQPQTASTPDIQINSMRPLTAPTVEKHIVPLEQQATSVVQDESEGTLLKVAKAVFHTSWMAFVLAVLIELIIIAIVSIGGTPDSFKPFLGDFVNKLSWGFLVCIALTIGTATTKFRVPLMSFLGLLFAPFAFFIAKVLGSGTNQILGVAPAPSDSTSPIVLATIRSVEYGVLGAALGFISQFTWGKVLAHLGIGLFAGVIFGGVLLIYLLQAAGTSVSALQVIARGVNELIFPIGCALIMFLTQSFSRLLPNNR